MTYSLIIREGDRIGVGVATAVPGGARQVPVVMPGRGALCVQGQPNPFWRPYGAMMLSGGASAESIVRTLVPPDPSGDVRQLLVLGSDGRFAGFTGESCGPTARDIMGDDFAAAGNTLASVDVLRAMTDVASTPNAPLLSRLLHALEAAEAAGGDARGTRSACLVIDGHMFAVDDQGEPARALAHMIAAASTPMRGGMMHRQMNERATARAVGAVS
ncbi:DUF1028 domain-containing protein [Reyranella soli]|uniref:Pilus assembly protein n=1 Tax=Reyranella soli TaxID=1230389 RepID=A0A512NS42_9HYPH|nr:DUF1028 domain-containing protein [Reyranella soli]GEP61770.1 pilus assembly protein [Reyranella soli]